MCILRLDIRQLITGVCYLTLDRIYTPVLGGIDIYHGFFAVTLCIAVITLVFTDTGRVTLQDPLCGIVEAVVFIHIVNLISSLITKGPDHYGWMVFIALYHILGAVHNGIWFLSRSTIFWVRSITEVFQIGYPDGMLLLVAPMWDSAFVSSQI